MCEPSRDEQPDIASRDIAIIDDDPMIRILMAELLIDDGFQPAVWDGTDDPATFVRRICPAVLVLDLHIGIGPAALRATPLEQIVALQTAAGAPTILCSADSSFLNEHAEALHAAGIQVLTKPFDIDAFVACVRAAVNQCTDTRAEPRARPIDSRQPDGPLP